MRVNSAAARGDVSTLIKTLAEAAIATDKKGHAWTSRVQGRLDPHPHRRRHVAHGSDEAASTQLTG